MPPHCDTLNGPVVSAAREALDNGDVNIVLPYAPMSAEDEIKDVFNKCAEVRKASGNAAEVADMFFFETVVRLHRAGEGAAFTGIKPAGLDTGPVIPVAEAAIETGDVSQLLKTMCDKVEYEVLKRFNHMKKLADTKNEGVDAARNYVTAMLHLQVYCHKLYKFAETGPTNQ
jgi:hypothetical protein